MNNNTKQCSFDGYAFQKLSSNGSIVDPDPLECIILLLPYILKHYQFGFIASGFVLLIIIISIFGRIKLHYRWFILNMAFIDLFTCYDVICHSAGWNCPADIFPLEYINLSRMISKLPYIGIFILTASRFLNLYFPNLYKQFGVAWKSFLVILFVDITYTLVNAIPLNLIDILVAQKCLTIDIKKEPNSFLFLKYLSNNNGNILTTAACDNENTKNETECQEINLLNCKNITFNSLKWIQYVILSEEILPFLALIFSIIFVASMIFKIIHLFKFQWKSNKDILKTNIQIVYVFSIQTTTLIFLSVMEFLAQLHDEEGRTTLIPPAIKRAVLTQLPFWFQCLLTSNSMRCHREIRTLLDSLIVLGVMKDYRNDLIFPFLWAKKKLFKNGVKKSIKVENLDSKKIKGQQSYRTFCSG